jgi:DNA polymerase sigma
LPLLLIQQYLFIAQQNSLYKTGTMSAFSKLTLKINSLENDKTPLP